MTRFSLSTVGFCLFTSYYSLLGPYMTLAPQSAAPAYLTSFVTSKEEKTICCTIMSRYGLLVMTTVFYMLPGFIVGDKKYRYPQFASMFVSFVSILPAKWCCAF
mmetsp:Transcript_6428/g.12736  ORF Transcript_6428/g.12736 Transcript_6428/m.12736 type:complete len:104 (+) Transcript_6428:178-489(+)